MKRTDSKCGDSFNRVWLCIIVILVAWPACAGPSGALLAAETGNVRKSLFRDVSLNSRGHLVGILLDGNGQPTGGQAVVVKSSRGQMAHTKSDRLGEFRIRVTRGGVYELIVNGRSHAFRIWTHGTAPPSAIAKAVIVTRRPVIRGQRPVKQLFLSDPVVWGFFIGGAIATPVAVHNTRSAS